VARDGKASRTDFRLIHRFQKYSWLEAVPQTGRTHQIRLHARALGHPLAVDPYYASAQPVFLSQVKPNYKPSRRGPERPWLSRLPLHATRLVLHLEGEEPRIFESPLPKDLARVVRDLKKYGRGH
jgi:23S rRNA pseudouridine955/2504/2580 synthase/23S rRNA pseudouridine1911/1915/1917 synthase